MFCCIQAAVAAATGLGVPPLGPVLKPTISLPVVQAVSGSDVGITLLKIVSLIISAAGDCHISFILTYQS